MTCPPQVWDGVLRRLERCVPPYELEAWLRPVSAQVRDGELHLLCGNAFQQRRLRERYLDRIQQLAEQEAGSPVKVRLSLGATKPEASPTPRARAAMPKAPARKPALRSSASASVSPRRSATPTQPSFDSFVVGSANVLAREASLAVVQARQLGVNPLYIASEPGLGKTHLARALSHQASQDGARVRYASAESFTNDFLACMRERRLPDFKRRFREECDLFVIEDVEFFRGKTSTQLELFYTVAHLLDTGGRIVFTADRLPRQIPDLEQRLCSQMASGLVVEIDKPDAELRRQILRSKAAAGGVRLPNDCLEHLIEVVDGSVRDLESALGQVVAMAALLKQPLDLKLTRAALRKLSSHSHTQPGLEPRQVIEVVAGFFGKSPEVLASRSRRRDVLLPRQLAMYLCHRYTLASLQSIGDALGRDHPAVRNALTSVERSILERAPLRYQVEALATKLDELSGRKPGSTPLVRPDRAAVSASRRRRGRAQRGRAPAQGASASDR